MAAVFDVVAMVVLVINIRHSLLGEAVDEMLHLSITLISGVMTNDICGKARVLGLSLRCSLDHRIQWLSSQYV